MTERVYNTALAKGQGMIPETLTLLRVWELGMNPIELTAKVLATGALSRATALRTKDLVNRVFAHRYLLDGECPARYLKQLLMQSIPVGQITQILLLHTARANLILFDFIREVYWEKYAAGASHLNRDHALQFIDGAVNSGSIPQRWSPSMNTRVARYLLNCLEEFGLLGPIHQGEREMLPFALMPITIIYLSHELHFAGLGDKAIMEHSDWGLFGLEAQDVVRELERVSHGGHFVVQYSGEILRIAWKYKTMEECLDAVAASELR